MIVSIPVAYRDRPKGSKSKLNTYSDGKKVLMTIFNLYRNYQPLRFFGVIAAFLGIVSILLFIPVFIEYIHTGLVPKFPTLIISGFLCVAAMLSAICGLILDTIAKNNRRNMEIQMNLFRMLQKR